MLTVLFCVSYALMTMLIVEQGATIESQRNLIRELFRDSSELSAMRMRAQQEKAMAAAQTAPSARTQAPVTQSPSSQVPSAQTPSTQIPSAQAPSSQGAVPKHPTTQKEKSPYEMPSRPAADLGDNRRSLITI